MTLLMLRGAQTPGELKSRSERMHHFDSPAEVEATLTDLAEGFDALVRELPRRPGQRENRWTHIVSIEPAESPDETFDAEPQRQDHGVARPAAVDPGPSLPEGPTPRERLDRLQTEVAELRDELRALRRRLGNLD